MKAENLVLLGIGAIILLHFANLGVASNVLQYYIQSVDFRSISNAQIMLMVQNPSNAQITLNSMAGTITANGTVLGNISNFSGGTIIPANQQQPVSITVNLSLANILSSLADILIHPDGTQPIQFIIQGNANVNGGIIVPFNIQQTVNV